MCSRERSDQELPGSIVPVDTVAAWTIIVDAERAGWAGGAGPLDAVFDLFQEGGPPRGRVSAVRVARAPVGRRLDVSCALFPAPARRPG